MTYSFTLPGVTPSQNELDGKHWRVKHGYKVLWHKIVGLVARRCPFKPGLAHVTIVRVSQRLIDPLNVYAGLKWLVDGLVEMGWLRGDAYKDMTIIAGQRKCDDGEDPHMEVRIEYETLAELPAVT